MNAIVYTSRTGFTKRYAQLLAKRTGVSAYSWKEAAERLPRGSEIFYMGWLMAGSVQGLGRAMDRYTVRGAAIVGISPAGNGDLWTEAKINGGVSDGGGRVFYLRGGYAPEKLGWLQRFLMRRMGASVIKKVEAKGSAATADEREMAALFRSGGDCVREEALEEIAVWFADGPHQGMVKAAPTVDL